VVTRTVVVLILAALLGSGDRVLADCPPQQGTFKLYRNSPLFPAERIHVATFDATHGETYNRENCITANKLFESQPGVIVRYWCESASAQVKQ
jgi:hypothetical protein